MSPRALEMRYKRDVEPGDGFVMNAGLPELPDRSCTRATSWPGTPSGAVVLRESGRMLMPLYQEQGEDGFFLVREFLPFWMGVSRRAQEGWHLAIRPLAARRASGRGLRRTKSIVDKRIARFFARQLFHLLGYRQLEDAGARSS